MPVLLPSLPRGSAAMLAHQKDSTKLRNGWAEFVRRDPVLAFVEAHKDFMRWLCNAASLLKARHACVRTPPKLSARALGTSQIGWQRNVCMRPRLKPPEKGRYPNRPDSRTYQLVLAPCCFAALQVQKSFGILKTHQAFGLRTPGSASTWRSHGPVPANHGAWRRSLETAQPTCKRDI